VYTPEDVWARSSDWKVSNASFSSQSYCINATQAKLEAITWKTPDYLVAVRATEEDLRGGPVNLGAEVGADWLFKPALAK